MWLQLVHAGLADVQCLVIDLPLLVVSHSVIPFLLFPLPFCLRHPPPCPSFLKWTFLCVWEGGWLASNPWCE